MPGVHGNADPDNRYADPESGDRKRSSRIAAVVAPVDSCRSCSSWLDQFGIQWGIELACCFRATVRGAGVKAVRCAGFAAVFCFG